MNKTTLCNLVKEIKVSFRTFHCRSLRLQKTPLHQVPIQLWSPVTGAIMTQNPSYFELAEGEKIRASFMPDDNESTIFVYEA